MKKGPTHTNDRLEAIKAVEKKLGIKNNMIKLKSKDGEVSGLPGIAGIDEYTIIITERELIEQLKHQGYGYSMLFGILKDYYDPMKGHKISPDKKFAFVKKHIKLVSKYFENNSQYRWQLVHLARKELGYSPKTVNQDICASLIHAYNSVRK